MAGDSGPFGINTDDINPFGIFGNRGRSNSRSVPGRAHFVPITDDAPDPDWLRNVTRSTSTTRRPMPIDVRRPGPSTRASLGIITVVSCRDESSKRGRSDSTS
jgi:hypothetical protein